MAITGTHIVFIKLITYKFCSSESYLLAIAACDVSHSKTLPCLALTVGILCIRIHAVIIQRISVYQKFLSHFYLCLCCVYIHRISGYVKYAVIAVLYSFVCIRGRLVCEQYTLFPYSSEAVKLVSTSPSIPKLTLSLSESGISAQL